MSSVGDPEGDSKSAIGISTSTVPTLCGPV